MVFSLDQVLWLLCGMDVLLIYASGHIVTHYVSVFSRLCGDAVTCLRWLAAVSGVLGLKLGTREHLRWKLGSSM